MLRPAAEGVGVYPETKHPTYFDSIGLSLEEPLVAALRKRHSADADDPVIIQSFEVGNLRELDAMVDVPLAQLVDAAGGPARPARATTVRLRLVTPGGPRRDRDVRRRARRRRRTWCSRATPPAGPVRRRRWSPDAHAAGLVVHVWTLRRENQFMATNFRLGTDPNAPGDLAAEARAFLDAGVDGIFSDNPDVVAGGDGQDHLSAVTGRASHRRTLTP